MKFNYKEYQNGKILPDVNYSYNLRHMYDIVSIRMIYENMKYLPINVLHDIQKTLKEHDLEFEELDNYLVNYV